MHVLFIDASSSTDQAVLEALYLSGYALTTTATVSEALNLIDRTEFDCILVNILGSAADDAIGVAEIRQFMRRSAIALVTSAPAGALVHEALAEGSIELQSLPDLIKTIDQLPQPALLVGRSFNPDLIKAIRNKGLRVSCPRTLQFAMNLLVDGWCQIVLLEADIRGLGDLNELAIFHEVNAKQLGILASALADTLLGITLGRKPQTAEQFISLLEQIAENRPGHCGRLENLGRQHRGAR